MSNITHKPIKPESVDVSAFKYSKVNSLPSGAKTIYINNGEGISPLFIQSPELTLPFDSGTYYSDNEKSGKWSIKVSMDDIESNPQMKHFHDMLVDMDKKIVSDGIENSVAWFKKKNPNADVIKELYTPMVKVSRDSETGEPNGKWAPSFGFKIVKRDGKVLADCYDSEKNKLDTEGENPVDLEKMFTKGTKVKMILKCNGLWIASGKFGCTWRAEQIKINTPVGFSGYAFEDSDEEDSGVELSRQDSIAPPKAGNYVEDSDDDKKSDEDSEGAEGSEDDGGSEEESNGVESKVVKRRVKKSI
jgi:hypothetical protein